MLTSLSRVTVSYRGYGKSTGQPSEEGIKLDCEAVLDYLFEHPELRDTSIILYGRSLGGAVSFYMASLPKASELIKGIVVENTFLSIMKLIPILFPYLSPLSFLCTERWYTEKIIPTLPTTIPVLFLSGGNDELVPPNHIRELYEMSKADVKEFKLYPKGTHNDTCVQDGYWTDVYQFIHNKVEPVEASSK
ncbi:hypothetical protein AWJ20_4162 [Sugiyamaella lignohabitans]|uniref:Uncharacterized protein n=1 Tax=Sugiyamaella lignohabitans TaxID=796027 RepID=A0A167C8H9_9ASCO|nr:uncharacterized protein AWJ20_4162 [Sugiyamaella lignohabitans]ANB11356.1 hypothetical protein AWJ20_4162 [Sugiyamaella lignohabitans]